MTEAEIGGTSFPGRQSVRMFVPSKAGTDRLVITPRMAGIATACLLTVILDARVALAASPPTATTASQGENNGTPPYPRHASPGRRMSAHAAGVTASHPLKRNKSASVRAERVTPAPAIASQSAGLPAAPVPDPDIEAPVPVTPDTIHTTPELFSVTHDKLGDGYTYGSSASALEDRNTAKTPGVAIAIPFK